MWAKSLDALPYFTLLYSTMLYSTLLYSTLLYSTLHINPLLCSAVLYLPVQMCEAEEEPIFHGIEDLALVAHIAEGKFLPRIFEHADQLGRGRS